MTPFVPIEALQAMDEAFLAKLDKAIVFHRNNQNDPHGLSNAAYLILSEVRNAFSESRALPITTP
jgi:hypothetical protein